jgi:hypothetical protein
VQRALLIRSSFGALPGGRNALDCMGSLLRAYGFEITECDGPAATRDNIVAALKKLVAETGKDDAAVVLYSGHARRANNIRYVPGGPVPATVEHICPVDYGESTDARFLGISAGELSLIFSKMRSANVTALFDCCYGSQLGRDDEPVVVWPAMTYAMLLGYFAALRAAEPQFDALNLAGNTNLVRIAASADVSFVEWLPPRAALEALGIECARTDELIGKMTSALVQILAPLRGRRVSWRQIVAELRSRLPSQRAEIGGPTQRMPFSLEGVDAITFGVSLEGAGAALDAGLLLGVSPGDVYAIVPAGETDAKRALARVTIANATASSATGPIEWISATHELPGTCVALALQQISPRHPVRIEAPAELLPAIGAAIERSPLLRVADARDTDPVAVIQVSGSSIVLGDGVGPLYACPHWFARYVDARHRARRRAVRTVCRTVRSSGGRPVRVPRGSSRESRQRDSLREPVRHRAAPHDHVAGKRGQDRRWQVDGVGCRSGHGPPRGLRARVAPRPRA